MHPAVYIYAYKKYKEKKSYRKSETDKKGNEEFTDEENGDFYSRKEYYAYLMESDPELRDFFSTLSEGLAELRNIEISKINKILKDYAREIEPSAKKISEIKKKLNERNIEIRDFDISKIDKEYRRWYAYIYKDGFYFYESHFTKSPNSIETDFEKYYKEEKIEELLNQKKEIEDNIEKMKKRHESKIPFYRKDMTKKIKEEEVNLSNIKLRLDKLQNIKKEKEIWDSFTSEDKAMIMKYLEEADKISQVKPRYAETERELDRVVEGDYDEKYIESAQEVYAENKKIDEEQINKAKTIAKDIYDAEESSYKHGEPEWLAGRLGFIVKINKDTMRKRTMLLYYDIQAKQITKEIIEKKKKKEEEER